MLSISFICKTFIYDTIFVKKTDQTSGIGFDPCTCSDAKPASDGDSGCVVVSDISLPIFW